MLVCINWQYWFSELSYLNEGIIELKKGTRWVGIFVKHGTINVSKPENY